MLQRICQRLSDPRVSRGLHIGLAGWFHVLLLVLLYLLIFVMDFLSGVFGSIWVPQERGAWRWPVSILWMPLFTLSFPLLPTLGVIGGILSLFDLFRRKRWALLGLVLSATLPLVVLFMISLMVTGRR